MCMAAFSLTGNPIVLQTDLLTPGLTLTPGTTTLAGNLTAQSAVIARTLTAQNAVISGNLTAGTFTANGPLSTTTLAATGNVSANTFTSVFTTAQGGGNVSNVSSLTLPLLGDHSQIWCKVTSTSAFTAALLAGSDSNSANYTSGLLSVTGTAASGVASVPLTQFSGGPVIMANCAANAVHSISVRAVNPAGVFDVDMSGTAAGAGAGVYRTTGAVAYAGTTPASVQIAFSPAVTSARYGVQQVLYT